MTMSEPTTGPRHLISVKEIDGARAHRFFDLAEALRALPAEECAGLLARRTVATAFYQPSTRTRIAFEAAAAKLGAARVGFADVKTTRAGDFYQESLEDVVRNLGSLVDALVLRHFESGAAARAAAVSPVPVVNAGDGYNEHPSQALGDVWTMHQLLGGVEGARIGLLGNPSIRSLHSIGFVLAALSPAEVVFLPAPGTEVPEDTRKLFEANGVRWSVAEHVADLLAGCDLVETIGTRHPDHNLAHDRQSVPEQTPERFRIDAALLRRVGREVPILHPGPRTDEIDTDVDALPVAQYLPQVTSGMWMKAAMLAHVLLSDDRLPL
ncbi:hypothetical protein [Kitasatospora purpeofusca]|uniref:Aspartate transcarbamylase n=1 Tax=Kitasatospora purpeofusca TaxID=67352 RepID=A0ABZ1U578_9ACTN|nr:hypothetical protein [Kitasatospora purpeofusca]